MGAPAGSTPAALVDGGGGDPSKAAAVQNVHSQDANAPAAGWFTLLVGSFSQLWNGATFDRQAGGADNADGAAVGAVGRLFAAARGFLFNGTSWDRARGNLSNISVVAALAAVGLGTVNGADQVNYNARGLKLVIDITVLGGTGPTLTVTIQAKDPVSGKYFTILASAALAAVATTVLTVYPGASVTANVSANDVLPRDWRVIYTVAGTGPAVTATIAASLIV